MQLSYFGVLISAMHAESRSPVWFFVTPWIIALQSPLSMDFLGKNIGVGCHFLLRFCSFLNHL